MNPYVEEGINTVNTTILLGVVWAKLEGKRHFPSDALFGYVMGSFISGFVYDALINSDPNESFAAVYTIAF